MAMREEQTVIKQLLNLDLHMELKEISHLSVNRLNSIKYMVFDGMAVAFIILAPAMAHLLSFPLYYLEPMRVMLILAMVHTTKQNGYLLAMILPFCSWIFSGHPELIKMLIITVELVANVAVYYWLKGRNSRSFTAMLISILASKLLCYLLYWMVFSSAFMASETGTTFLAVQLVVSVVFACYTFLFAGKPGKVS
jgi:hypothetical protein